MKNEFNYETEEKVTSYINTMIKYMNRVLNF